MTDRERQSAAKEFVTAWTGRGDEKQDAQNYWRHLLDKVYGLISPETEVLFEHRVKNDQTGTTIFIDAYIKATSVLVEQKGKDIDLRKSYRQSDGSMLTPFQQARRYAGLLPHNMNPRWIVVCNFQEFHIHDMNNPNGEPYVVKLADLEKEYNRLGFLIDTGNENLKREMEISIKAGKLVGTLYEAFLKQYRDPASASSLHSLNALCVRLVFCLYAEDSGLFDHLAFHDYMMHAGLAHSRQALIDLFHVLDQDIDQRDPYLSDELAAFPYVNGGLFSDENIEIPRLTQEIFDLLLRNASENFDWSEISPTIFGAVFESTLNPETRRKGGMHYTSIENIHKVIDPLFLDELKAEFSQIMKTTVLKNKEQLLKDFQKKLASQSYLDPACGSGNFLTESYLSIRKIENRIIEELVNLRHTRHRDEKSAGQIAFGGEAMKTENPIQVSIEQFYGIEINDFAVTVAKTALWIAESQMMKETEQIVHSNLNFLPLKTNAHIVHGNALRLDWNDVIPKAQLNYIMGNPPFISKTGRTSANESHSAAMLSDEQKKDKELFFEKNAGILDYVSCWYMKAADYTKGTCISSAFVSTSSICQGQQVEPMWKPLIEKGIIINFAYSTFKWVTEAEKGAYVYVVIIGFSHIRKPHPVIISGEIKKQVSFISPYLIEGEPILIPTRNHPLFEVPEIGIGNKPIDGGNYLFKREEKEEFIKKEPMAAQYFHPWYGADEFINGQLRYCLWLGDCTPLELKKMPECMKRVQAVRNVRLSSKSPGTVKIADKPTRFHVENMPKGNYIVIPEVSAGSRNYIPIGYMDDSVLCSNKLRLMPNSTLYHFGILTSSTHMGWMRTVGGYFGPSYQYSVNVVYNNFPWPTPTETQKARIESTAQAILDARALYPDTPFSVLYNDTLMPPELRTAHQQNDRAVWEAYGKAWDIKSESECVAYLMRMYQSMTAK